MLTKRITIDDQDFQKIQHFAVVVQKCWYCLNRLAAEHGNPFKITSADLCDETNLIFGELWACLHLLQSLEMLDIERGRTYRSKHQFTLMTGTYANHTQETEA